MSTSEDLNQKLQRVLQLFLQQDYNIVTPTYLDLLHTHIVEEIRKDNQVIFQTVQNWIITALNTWNEKFKPCQNVITFTIKLIGSLAIAEPIFAHLNENGVHNRTCQIFELERRDLPASIKMAFTMMFVNFLEHESGRSWIASTGSWKVILRFAQLNHTMYVTKESQKFLATLLLRECYNQNFCKEIIIAVTQPLVDATFQSETSDQNSILDKQVVFKKNDLLLMTLELLWVIMDTVTFHDLSNPVPAMFEELTSLQSRVNLIFEVTISTPLMKTAHKLAKLLVFTKLRESMRTSETLDEESFEQFCLGLGYTSSLLLSKKYILELVISKKLGIIYWKKLNKLKSLEIPRQYKFENQGITLMIIPFCVTMKPSYIKEHYLFEEFVEKLFDVTCTPVQRLAYSTRDVILKNDFPMEIICKATVDHILEIVDIIDRETAVIVFQSFCHSLKSFVTESRNNLVTMQQQQLQGAYSRELSSTNTTAGPSKNRPTYRHFLDGDPINDKPMLLAALLHGMNILTEKFKLKWQECVETICVLSIAQDILNHPGVEPKICMLALRSCKLAIQNFMPPNLALLVDFDEHTKEIGPTLYKRLHDSNWEVQDSVLEILNTIACLSENKYPPYQGLILENNFLEVAVDIIMSETESYVRASALIFISTAVRINTLWEKLLSQLNLPDIAIKLVNKEDEALVRREAVALIKELYVHRSWQKPMISTMTQVMTAAAVLDLHWEVKINALEFWRHFIKSHLTDQGMLDGHFPSVTFSKEHRKIVSLNENEIKQRLNKALDELSKQNCLGVLLVTLKDDSDFEVSKTSANIIGDLRRVLLEYKLNEPMPEPLLPKDSAIIDTNYIKQPETNKNDDKLENTSNNIIDEIVDASDANLLTSIYRDSMKMNDDEIESTRNETFNYIATITRQKFLTKILNFDLDAYVKERSEWLENYTTSFDSIIEDILSISEKKDINVMDCY